MRVIILAAGAGQRFKDAGINTPKPLIQVDGAAMLTHTMSVVAKVDTTPVIVTTAQIADYLSRVHSLPVVPVYHHQQGAALSLLCANGWVPDDEQVMVVDCDNRIDRAAFNEFADFAIEKEANVCMTTIDESEIDSFSFVHGFGGNLGYVVERSRISSRITCGVNVFKSWAVLRHAICCLVACGEKYNGEYYLPLAYNVVVGDRFYFDIPEGAFNTVGTPAQLKAYEERHKHANKNQ